jgi:hypothetical protein
VTPENTLGRVADDNAAKRMCLIGSASEHTLSRRRLSVSTTVVEETRRLRENLRAAREAMADLRRELAKSRRG